jgi:hypothetical protein
MQIQPPLNEACVNRRPDPDDYVDEAARPYLAERMRRRAARVEKATSEHVKQLEESGELRHMHGKPLNLDDDPDWLVTKVLKQAGISHPLIEQRKDLYRPLEQLESRIERLERQRAWLLRPESKATPDDVRLFNSDRQRFLDDYRSRLHEVNRGIRDFNLTAPDALQERPLRVDATVASAEERVPALHPSNVPQPPHAISEQRWWHILRRRQSGT